MDAPFFSVIIPFCDESLYIRDTVASVLKQQFTNFELICINDESTDDSVKVIQRAAGDDARVKIISQHHSGKCIARNNGIRHAKAPWICFLNSGDTYYENHLRTLHQLITENTGHASGFATEHLNGNEFGDFDKKVFFRQKEEIVLSDIDDFTPISLNQFCFNREEILKTLFPSMKLPVSEDLLFVRQFLLSHPILKINVVTTVAQLKPRYEKNSLTITEKVQWHRLASDILLNNFVSTRKLKNLIRFKTNLRCAKMYFQQRMFLKAIGQLFSMLLVIG